MIILFSPTKTQKAAVSNTIKLPMFHHQSEPIIRWFQQLSPEQIAMNFHISEDLSLKTYNLFQNFMQQHTALQAYQGSSFKHLDAASFTIPMNQYAAKHFYILSALYGLIKADDTIGLYRLDFKTKTPFNLYDYWKPYVNEVLAQHQTIINLASEEYADLVQVPKIDIVFYEQSLQKLVTKATYAKMARGKMARYLIEKQITDCDDIKKFNEDNYCYDDALSDQHRFVFIR